MCSGLNHSIARSLEWRARNPAPHFNSQEAPQKQKGRPPWRTPFENPLPAVVLAAAGGAAAVRAFVAAAVGGHEHAALGAGRRIVNRRACTSPAFGIAKGFHHGHGSGGLRSSWRSFGDTLFFDLRSIDIKIIRRDEFSAEPTPDVIHHGFRVANLGVAGVARRFEA